MGLLLAYAAYFLYKSHVPSNAPASGLPFCNSVNDVAFNGNVEYKNCEPCPDYGFCIDGKLLECEKGYIRKNNVCVKDEKIDRIAYRMLEVLQTKLSTLRGMYECGKSGIQPLSTVMDNNELNSNTIGYPDMKGMQMKQAQKYLEDRFLHHVYDNTHEPMDQQLFNDSWNEMMKLIKSAPQNFALDIEKQPGSQVDEHIYSTKPSIPLYCKVVKAIRDNTLPIAGVLVFLLLLWIGNRTKKRHDQERLDLEDLIRIVITRCREKGAIEQLVIKADLKEQYPDIDVDKLWPRVGGALGEDARIAETTNEFHNLVWTFRNVDNNSAAVNAN